MVMEEPTLKELGGQKDGRKFLRYLFFKVSREWRSLDPGVKDAGQAGFRQVLGKYSSALGLRYYSLVGIRADADFMIWMVADDLRQVQEFVAGLLSTGLGKYLDVAYSYLAMTKKSRYLGSHRHPGQEGEGTDSPRSARYLFVYPLVKKREWYSLPFVERQRIMADHFKIGHKYPSIKINTGYSFGLDDQEFVVAFEGDEPSEFLDLVEELRSSEASRYTERETPTFTCAAVDEETLVRLLG
jgi:chlorite dismutase